MQSVLLLAGMPNSSLNLTALLVLQSRHKLAVSEQVCAGTQSCTQCTHGYIHHTQPGRRRLSGRGGRWLRSSTLFSTLDFNGSTDLFLKCCHDSDTCYLQGVAKL